MSFNSNNDLIETDLLTMLETRATTPSGWDALVFFGQHPTARMRAATIAQLSGASERQAAQDLDRLIALGVLTESKNGQQTNYALASEPVVRQAVIHFARRSKFD